MLNQFEFNESKSVLLGPIHFVNRRFEVLPGSECYPKFYM